MDWGSINLLLHLKLLLVTRKKMRFVPASHPPLRNDVKTFHASSSSPTLHNIPKNVNKGRENYVNHAHGLQRPNGPNPYRKPFFQRCVPTCHWCGKVSHIPPDYRMLKFRTLMTVTSPPKRMVTPPRSDMKNFISIIKDIAIRLDKLEGRNGPT